MRFNRTTGVIAGLAISLLGATVMAPGTATGSSLATAAGPGITIVPAPVEPGEAQFVPGTSNVVPPTAPPATDIGKQPVQSLAVPYYACPGFSGLDAQNPLANLYRDEFTWAPYAPTKVGNGGGNINWAANPYKNASWYMWLHSLRWLGQGIVAASNGDLTALTRVDTIAYDWYRDNPYSWKGNVGAWESTMHRTNVLICLRQAVLSGLQVTTLPAHYAWIDTALLSHARFLTNYWSGAWNHGTDESIALFGVGVTLNRSDYKNLAVQRLAAGITTSIDSQGSTNEQSTGYASFNYSLWGRAIAVLQNGGVDPGTTMSTRRALLGKWLALATNSLGKLPQIGDTELQATYPWPGTPMEYAGSLGSKGTVPPWRIGVYTNGYVFGRTGWGTDPARGFTGESAYSIRFGPARAFHGHSDHTGITYTARGRDIVINGGYAAYNAGCVAHVDAQSECAQRADHADVDRREPGDEADGVLGQDDVGVVPVQRRARVRHQPGPFGPGVEGPRPARHLGPRVGEDGSGVPDAVAPAGGPTRDCLLANHCRCDGAGRQHQDRRLPGALPAGASARGDPGQAGSDESDPGLDLSEQLRPQVGADGHDGALRQDGVDPVVRRPGPRVRIGHLQRPLLRYDVRRHPQRRRQDHRDRHLRRRLPVPGRLIRRRHFEETSARVDAARAPR
ncbi:hypothetical protein [Kribbella sp. NPDC000426]|uniref:hypothetical protein n=1 Tax=Kribbella sp. NPDC000426 TaxID=3154255 RepID=UPI003316FFFD